jgi:hypothetical protein
LTQTLSQLVTVVRASVHARADRFGLNFARPIVRVALTRRRLNSNCSTSADADDLVRRLSTLAN